MKRDMELVRLLLLSEESGTDPEELSSYPVDQQLYNLQLMVDAGLIVATFVKDGHGNPKQAFVQRLTWEGHDFLDATKDSKIWKKVREHVIKPGASWTFQTLLEFLKREIESKLGGG